jgi:hypothetical protein
MTDLTQAVADLTGLFEQMGLPYAVMGGFAVRAFGIPRATYDVDFTLAIDRTRLAELCQAVGRLDYTVPEPYLSGWIDQVKGLPLVKFRLYLESRGADIDVFLAESPYQEVVLDRRRREEVEGRSVWPVSPEDLVLLKLFAGRPRDIADIGDVMFTQRQLDVAYMRNWAGQLGLRDELERVLTESKSNS